MRQLSQSSRLSCRLKARFSKGYLCRDPRRLDAAIRIGAFAEAPTSDFADGEAVRAVLRDLLEQTTATR
jgi:hypothetical protein